MPMRVPMVNLRKQGSKPWEGLGSRDHQSSGGRDGRVPGAVSGRGRGSRAHGWRAWGPCVTANSKPPDPAGFSPGLGSGSRCRARAQAEAARAPQGTAEG